MKSKIAILKQAKMIIEHAKNKAMLPFKGINSIICVGINLDAMTSDGTIEVSYFMGAIYPKCLFVVVMTPEFLLGDKSWDEEYDTGKMDSVMLILATIQALIEKEYTDRDMRALDSAIRAIPMEPFPPKN